MRRAVRARRPRAAGAGAGLAFAAARPIARGATEFRAIASEALFGGAGEVRISTSRLALPAQADRARQIDPHQVRPPSVLPHQPAVASPCPTPKGMHVLMRPSDSLSHLSTSAVPPPTRRFPGTPSCCSLGALAAGFGLFQPAVFAQTAPPAASAASAPSPAASASAPTGDGAGADHRPRQGRDRQGLGAGDDDDRRPRQPGPARRAAVDDHPHREAARGPPHRHGQGGAALHRRHHVPGGRGRRGGHPPARLLADGERRHLRRQRPRPGVLRPRRLQLRPHRAAARLGVDAVRARLDRRRRQPGQQAAGARERSARFPSSAAAGATCAPPATSTCRPRRPRRCASTSWRRTPTTGATRSTSRASRRASASSSAAPTSSRSPTTTSRTTTA